MGTVVRRFESDVLWRVKYTQLLLTVLITKDAIRCHRVSPIRLHTVHPGSTHTDCTNQDKLTPLGLSFTICQMGIVNAQASQRLRRGLSEMIHVKLITVPTLRSRQAPAAQPSLPLHEELRPQSRSRVQELPSMA